MIELDAQRSTSCRFELDSRWIAVRRPYYAQIIIYAFENRYIFISLVIGQFHHTKLEYLTRSRVDGDAHFHLPSFWTFN
jgi:hypothetical protein